MMNPEVQKMFRIHLLQQLRAAGRHGQTVQELRVGAKAVGHNVDAETVSEEVQYLQDKRQVEELPAEISPEVKSYRVTAIGRDWLAEHNL